MSARKIIIRRHKRRLSNGKIISIRRHSRTLKRRTRVVQTPILSGEVSTSRYLTDIETRLQMGRLTNEVAIAAFNNWPSLRTIELKQRTRDSYDATMLYILTMPESEIYFQLPPNIKGSVNAEITRLANDDKLNVEFMEENLNINLSTFVSDQKGFFAESLSDLYDISGGQPRREEPQPIERIEQFPAPITEPLSTSEPQPILTVAEPIDTTYLLPRGRGRYRISRKPKSSFRTAKRLGLTRRRF